MENYVIIAAIVLFIAWVITYRKLKQARSYRQMERRRLDFTLAFINNTINKKIIEDVDINFLADNKILSRITLDCEEILNKDDVKIIGQKLAFINSLDIEKRQFLLHQMVFVASTMNSHELARIYIKSRFFWHQNHSRITELVVNFILSLAEENKINRANFISACMDVANNEIVSKNEQMTPDIETLLRADIINAKRQLRVTD